MAKEKIKKLYLQHDSNARNDIKILALRSEMGMQGYGIFWALLEMLYDANEYELPTNYRHIAFELRAKKSLVQAVVENYDLFVIADEKFYSKSLKQRISEIQKTSERLTEAGLKGAYSRWNKGKQTQMPTTSTDRNALRQRQDLIKSFGINALADNQPAIRNKAIIINTNEEF